jgi:type II secretory pathway component PulF
MRAQHFYRGLASMLRAGVLIPAAADELARNGTIPLSLANSIHTRVGGGERLATVLADRTGEFPPEDVAFISAGEETGRLDSALDRLADLHDQRRQMWVRFRNQSIWPVIILHVAFFAVPIALMGFKAFAKGHTTTVSFVLIILFWALVVLFLLGRDRADLRVRLRSVIEYVPGFGAAARHQRHSLFAAVLEASHETGLTLDHGARLAGEASGTPAATAAALQVSKGVALGTALAQTQALTPELTSRIATAETSGELSEELRRIAAEERASAESAMDRAVTISTRGAYALLALGTLFYALYILSGVFSQL